MKNIFLQMKNSRPSKFKYAVVLFSLLVALHVYQVHAITVINKSPQQALTSGLVGYWTFDGSKLTTTTATDSMGTQDGTLTSSPSPTAGVIGQGLQTGNPGGHVALGDTFDMGLNSMTLSIWFKSTNLQQVVSAEGLIGKALFGTQNGRYGIYTYGGTMYAFLETSSEVLVSTDVTAYNDGKFHLATAVYDRTGNLTFYIDGVNKSSASISAKSGDNVQTANTFLIGKYNDASGGDTAANSFSFTGSLDDARVYNRALSASEVSALYTLTQGKIVVTKPNPAKVNVSSTKLLSNGLVGYWTFDGPKLTSTTAANSVGSTDGTLRNSPISTMGIMGQALTTGGTNSGYINVGDNFDMGLNSLTLSIWFKTTDSLTSPGVYGLISKALYGNVNGRYSLDVLSPNLDVFIECPSETHAATPVAPYIDGKWHNAVAVINRTGNISLYVDGVVKSSTSISAYAANNCQTTSLLLIGSYNDGSGGETTSSGNFRFPGSIDDARIYTRAFSAAEVLQLYRMVVR